MHKQSFKTFCRILLLLMSTGRVLSQNCCPENNLVTNITLKPFKCQDSASNENDLQFTCNPDEDILAFSERFVNFTVTKNGTLSIWFQDDKSAVDVLDFHRFCLGRIRDKTNLSRTIRTAVFCTEKNDDQTIQASLIPIGAAFLFLTALVYAALPELRDLQGLSIVNLCGSLGMGLVIMAIMHMPYTDMTLCAVRGFLSYFFLIAAFFWMNAISIQTLRSIRRPTITAHGCPEFIWYALYAWGCPVILTLVMAVINFLPDNDKGPGIGLNSCWFITLAQKWYYMYSVMTVLLVTNVCIFVYTTVFLWRNTFASTHIKSLQKRFTMMLRLCIITGLPWLFDMIGSFNKQSTIWLIVDVFNILQGVIIFVLLVLCRRRALKAIHQRGGFCCLTSFVDRLLSKCEDDEVNIDEHTNVMVLEDKL